MCISPRLAFLPLCSLLRLPRRRRLLAAFPFLRPLAACPARPPTRRACPGPASGAAPSGRAAQGALESAPWPRPSHPPPASSSREQGAAFASVWRSSPAVASSGGHGPEAPLPCVRPRQRRDVSFFLKLVILVYIIIELLIYLEYLVN